MRLTKFVVVAVFAALLGAVVSLGKDSDAVALVKKAAARSTLNQPGTKPFHLQAVLSPTRKSGEDAYGNGTVEIWWNSPDQWRREVSAQGFRQTDIVNANAEWQKSEGDYFPEWLREIAVALIDPLPSSDVFQRIEGADVKRLFGTTAYSWSIMSGDGNVQKGMGAGIQITDSTGLLEFADGLGWGGGFAEYKGFHGRMVARTVTCCTIEVTAKVAVLEDLKDMPPDFFNASAPGGDPQPLRTVVVEETTLRKNLLPMQAPAWPPIANGPREGVLTSKIVVDRTGAVREVGSIVSDNSAINDAAKTMILAMRFKPYLQDGVPVQVVSRITMPFGAARPAGMEDFGSARSYFERVRKAGYPAAGSGPPYTLRATFRVGVKSGKVMDGQYVDTWENDSEWRREASIGKSTYVRTRHNDKGYQMAKGPDAPLLEFVFRVIEPIPAMDTFIESDWRAKRDTVAGVPAVRILSGYESPDGVLDPEQARGYWFDSAGNLVESYFNGVAAFRLNFQDFNGVQIAREIRVIKDGKLAMLIQVTDVSPATPQPDSDFEIRGHEWTRAFTDQVR